MMRARNTLLVICITVLCLFCTNVIGFGRVKLSGNLGDWLGVGSLVMAGAGLASTPCAIISIALGAGSVGYAAAVEAKPTVALVRRGVATVRKATVPNPLPCITGSDAVGTTLHVDAEISRITRTLNLWRWLRRGRK